MDPSSIIAGMTGMNHAISLLKEAVSGLKLEGKHEVMGKFFELQATLWELSQEHQKVMFENQALKKELQEAKALFALKQSMEYFYGAYWKNREGGGLDGPYSTLEMDKNSLLVRLQLSSFYKDAFTYTCHDSGNEVDVPREFLIANKVATEGELCKIALLQRRRHL